MEKELKNTSVKNLIEKYKGLIDFCNKHLKIFKNDYDMQMKLIIQKTDYEIFIDDLIALGAELELKNNE